MKYIYIMLFTLITCRVEAKYINDLAILGLKYKDLKDNYIIKEDFSLYKNNTLVRYGSDEFGFFKTKIKKGKIRIIVPYYNEKVIFKINNKIVLEKKYVDPTPDWIKSNWKYQTQGVIDTKFFLVNLNIYRKWKSNKLNALVILNNRKEIVWCHILNKGIINKSMRYSIIKRYGNNIYVVYRNIKDGQKKEKVFLEKINLYDNSVEFKDISKIKIHHDFIVDNEIMFFLKKDNKYIRNKFLKVNKWQGDKILKWNMRTGEVDELWSSYEYIFPSIKQILNTKSHQHKAQEEDFTHANSIFKRKNGGFVVSFRNLNKVVLLDQNMEYIKELYDKEVYYQHDVKEVLDNKYLLFNNRKEKESYVELRNENFKLEKRSKLKFGVIHSPIRSSVDMIGDRVLAFFVGTKERGLSSIVEFNSESFEEKGRIDIFHPAKGSGFYRVIPFDNIVKEDF